MIFNYDAKKTHFHNKGFALRLVLKVRFFGTRKWRIILGRTYEIISCSRFIRYVLECHLLDCLWVKISVTLCFTFFESLFGQWINTFCCKRVHVVIWKSCGIRSLERGQEGNLNKILKDFKTFIDIDNKYIHWWFSLLTEIEKKHKP